MSFHEKLRFLRKQKGLKQKDVAGILKMPPNTYNGYETGKRMPNVELLRELSILLNVSVDYLISNNIVDNDTKNTKVSESQAKYSLTDNEDFTQDELEELEKFKEFIKSKRNK